VSSYEIERKGVRDVGLALLAQIEPEHSSIGKWRDWLTSYRFHERCPDDDYSWLTCVLALKSVRLGNFGVGSILVAGAGNVVAWSHNRVFAPHFRSDRHAEMVVVDEFEDACQGMTKLESYTLYTSLESCPMCLTRLIISRIGRIAHVADDTVGGMVHRLKSLPTIWIDLASSHSFIRASCSTELRKASTQIFLINADELNNTLKGR
jgi:tRNA(Arg) A34 adenosine deaminase TadA